MIISAGTDKGSVRRVNEDNFWVCGEGITYFVVADGMGGHKGGVVASSTAIENIKMYLTDIRMESCDDVGECLKKCFDQANISVYKKASEDDELAGMGTTLVLAYIDGSKAYIVNVGDSRCYHIHDGKINQITKDHSVVQELFENGSINRSEMRNHPNKNIITRAIGTNFKVKSDIFKLSILPGDGLILCSDGLSNMIEDNEILSTYMEYTDTDECVNKLIEKANNAGGTDNITVVVAKF